MGIEAFSDSHDPFWPRVELGRVRACLARCQPVSEAAFELAARCAIIAAAQEFARWRTVLRQRGYSRLDEVCGHDQGRALRICYVRFVEAAILHRLCGAAPNAETRAGAGHD